jgi:thioredoxin reductase
MTTRPYDIVIVGGGPAATAEGLRLSGGSRRIAVVTDSYGGCMSMLADQRLQSYMHELEIGGGTRRLANYVRGVDRISPTGTEFTGYVADLMRGLPIVQVVGNVVGIESSGRDFAVEYRTAQGIGVLRAAEVILASGLMPRHPGPWAIAGKTITCFEAYRDIGLDHGVRFRGRDVVVVGSGNSAYQIAASLARLAQSVVILANSYLGLYPQESDDRFALRAPSQMALEMIAKTGAQDIIGPINCDAKRPIAPMWLHVYSRLTWDPGEQVLTAHIRRSDNTAKVPASSCELAIAAGRIQMDGENEGTLRMSGDNLLVVSAIGVRARLPETAWCNLIEPASGFVRHEQGRTAVPGLYAAGACAGYPSINLMQSPVFGWSPARRPRAVA